jgi:hypothetical protein
MRRVPDLVLVAPAPAGAAPVLPADDADAWWRSIDAARRLIAHRPFRPAAVDGGFGEALSEADWALAVALGEADEPPTPLAALVASVRQRAAALMAWMATPPRAAPPPPTEAAASLPSAAEEEQERAAANLARALLLEGEKSAD